MSGARLRREAAWFLGASLAAALCLRYLLGEWSALALVCGALAGLALRAVMRPAFAGFPSFLQGPLLVGLVAVGTVVMSLASLSLYQKELWVLRWRESLVLLTIAAVLGLAEAALIYSHARLRDEIEASRRREAELERRALKARFDALQAQINPHFLFNTFNALSELVHSDPEDAEALVLDLAHLLRYTLRSSAAERVELGQEIEAVERYLRIEKGRFGERLAVRIDVEDGLEAAKIPGLIVQPLVENAVLYAVAERREGGRIAVSARRETEGGPSLAIVVEDDGPGLPPFLFQDEDRAEEPAGTGGAGGALANIRGRLALAYGAAASLDLGEAGPGARITLRLPL